MTALSREEYTRTAFLSDLRHRQPKVVVSHPRESLGHLRRRPSVTKAHHISIPFGDETLSVTTVPAMGALDRIVMQSCVNATRGNLTSTSTRIMYDAAIISGWLIRNFRGHDDGQHMPQSQVSHHLPIVLPKGCAGIPGQVPETTIIIMNNDSLASCR